MLSSATLSSSTCGASGPSTTKFDSYLLRFHVTNWKSFCDINAFVNVGVCVCVSHETSGNYYQTDKFLTLDEQQVK